jgi:hypothetical protein
MATGVELDPAQRGAVDALVRRQHHVMINGGPGMGKTTIGAEIARECVEKRVAFLATGSSDRVVANLVARGMPGANLQRLVSELRRLEQGRAPSEYAVCHDGLVALLAAVRAQKPAVIFIDECGLISAQSMDALLRHLFAANPVCFESRKVLLYMTGDFANQLPPVEGDAFIFSEHFSWIRGNTFFARLTEQHRFSAKRSVGMEVSALLAASDGELENYLKAHQRAYTKADKAWLAGRPTFVTSRQACEQHIRNATLLLIGDRQLTVHTVLPPAGKEGSTASLTCTATYYQASDWAALVEVTTMGGPLKCTNEEGGEVLLPNRHLCTLHALFDTPDECSATTLFNKATVSLGYRSDADADEEVVTAPLIHKKDGVPCVTVRSVGFEDVLSCYLAYNAQGYEYPGTLAVGALDVDAQLPISREQLLMVATRTPEGPTSVLFNPALKLRRGNRDSHAEYRRQLAHFTPNSKGDGRSAAAGKRKLAPAEAAQRPREMSAPPSPTRARPGLSGFLGPLL